MATWDTGRGALAIGVAALLHPLGQRRAQFRGQLRGLATPADRDAFARVVTAIAEPDLPDDEGNLVAFYDAVEEGAHRV